MGGIIIKRRNGKAENCEKIPEEQFQSVLRWARICSLPSVNMSNNTQPASNLKACGHSDNVKRTMYLKGA